jgi:hypothetical protein
MEKSEDRLQEDIVQYMWNNHPETRGLFCYNLNNSKNAIDGHRNKLKGLIQGRSDLVFYWLGRAYFFELKTSKGRQSPEQKDWETLVTKHGFMYYIVRNLDEFKMIIERVL